MCKEAITWILHGEHRSVATCTKLLNEAEVEEQVVAVSVEKHNEPLILISITILLGSEAAKAIQICFGLSLFFIFFRLNFISLNFFIFGLCIIEKQARYLILHLTAVA